MSNEAEQREALDAATYEPELDTHGPMSDETLNPLGGRWVAADGTPTEPTYATEKDRHIASLESQNQALQENYAMAVEIGKQYLARADNAEANWEEARSVNQALQEVLDLIATIQPGVLSMLRREGFKFETPLTESEGWEKLAFTLYLTICEVDSIARNALSPTQETDPE